MRDEPTNQRDDLDMLLDAALATYVDVESRPGLTQRILAATAHPEQRRLPFQWLSWAVPALGVLALMAILLVNRSPAPHPTSASAARPPTPSAPPAITVVETPQQLRQRLPRPVIQAASSTSNPLPRLEVFPTPTALSPEEQALVALVNRDSRDSKDLVQQITQPDPQGQPIEPLRIAAIHIPPLNPPDNNNN